MEKATAQAMGLVPVRAQAREQALAPGQVRGWVPDWEKALGLGLDLAMEPVMAKVRETVREKAMVLGFLRPQSHRPHPAAKASLGYPARPGQFPPGARVVVPG